jgi:hypothetical protein
MIPQPPVKDVSSVREYWIKPLGLVVGLSRCGIRVRRARPGPRPRVASAYQTPLDWVRYCESVRRR